MIFNGQYTSLSTCKYVLRFRLYNKTKIIEKCGTKITQTYPVTFIAKYFSILYVYMVRMVVKMGHYFTPN